MAYCTREDLTLKRISAAKLDELDGKQAGAVAEAIESASAHMDSILAKRYPVPITAPGALPVLKLCCAALARFECLNRLGIAHVNADVVADYDYWVKYWLDGVRNGSVVIPMSDTEDGTSDGGFVIEVKRIGSDASPSTPLFGWDQIKDF